METVIVWVIKGSFKNILCCSPEDYNPKFNFYENLKSHETSDLVGGGGYVSSLIHIFIKIF
jgi:hypothetical protein